MTTPLRPASKSDSPAFFEERVHGSDSARPHDVRTAYERDRARVIHSAGFRRLQGKTQVMGVGEGDFHRTRLTHSIECTQIGTGLLDQLERSGLVPTEFADWMPPRALVEAACFAHDLGHPPFGHGGEQALFKEMRMHGGFEGNAQTVRLLTRLEKAKTPDHGINPTRRLILAVLKYPKKYSSFPFGDRDKFAWKPPKCYFDEESDVIDWATEGFRVEDREQLAALGSDGKPSNRSFDSSLMELADDIAYGIHDIEDIVARRLAEPERIKDILGKAFDAIGGSLTASDGRIDADAVFRGLFLDSFSRKQIVGRLVNIFVTAVRLVERASFAHPLLRFRVALPSEHQTLLEKIKRMSFKLVIDKAPVQQLERRGMQAVGEIFQEMQRNPKQLIPSWDSSYRGPSTIERRVCDYVSGMTDNYAEKVYRRLFVPGFGSSSDEL